MLPGAGVVRNWLRNGPQRPPSLRDAFLWLIKVDATSSTDSSEKLGVSSYPTLFFFVDGGHVPYTRERTKDGIVNYANSKLSLTVRALTSMLEAEPLWEAKSPIAVASLSKVEGVEVDEVTSVAKQEEDVTFYITSDENVAAKFGLDYHTKPTLVLLKNVPDKRLFFDGILKGKELREFILCFVKDDEHWGSAQVVFEKVARMYGGQVWQAVFIRVRLGDSDAQQASH